MNRRQLLSAGCTAAAAASAGCLGVLTGSEPATFEASKATVGTGTLQATGYEEVEVRSQTVNRTFTVAGQTREAEVTNWEAKYDRTVELPGLGERPLAVFVAVSTPQVRVLGRTFNPVGQLSNRALLREVQSRYEGFDLGDSVGSSTVTVLGNEMGVEQFEASATYEGQSVDLYVHVTTVPDGGDYVVPVAVYPRRLDGETDRVHELYGGIQH